MARMKKSVSAAVAACLALVAALGVAGCSGGAQGSAEGDAGAGEGPAAGTVAVVSVEGYDPFEIALCPDDAPATVANFTKLAQEGFYDGLTFYRFVDGFCMQGGSTGNSMSIVEDGLDTVPGEFSGNGYANALADDFQRGVVAMARSSDPDSAKSTFFITLGSGAAVAASLNGQYAAFGTIDEAGMAVVDQIVADHLSNVSDIRSGFVADEAAQARIVSITIR